jgi:hypothetical protein
MLLDCEKGKVPPAGPVNVPINDPASDVEFAPYLSPAAAPPPTPSRPMFTK